MLRMYVQFKTCNERLIRFLIGPHTYLFVFIIIMINLIKFKQQLLQLHVTQQLPFI